MSEHDTTLAKRYHAALACHVQGEPSVALLDYPDYSNVGDSAIFLGELAALEAIGAPSITYCGAIQSRLETIDKFCPDGPLLMQGGGNFGDIWPRHQAYRLSIFANYRHRKIVILPQTLHFSGAKNLEATARAIAAHGNVHLMVRDKVSFELARRAFDCPVELVPDAAHCLSIDFAEPTEPLLAMARSDREARHIDLAKVMADKGRVADWPETRQTRARASYGPLDAIATQFVSPNSAYMRNRLKRFKDRAQARLTAGVALLERAKIVVSDRLHVHVLCELGDRRHIVLDNSYGKISRYIETWGSSPNSEFMRSLGEIEERFPSLTNP